jgi:SAM-dependent methyltransferase
VSSHDELAQSFDAAADVYERSRPGYPSESVDWLLEGVTGSVLDLGAGTGKLTRQLVGRVEEVIAVEPSDRMRERLSAGLPGVRALPGTAEHIPLDDGSTELVLVAQAWHWMDPIAAAREIARVLRGSGRLGLVWNLRDESVPWVARLSEIMGGRAAAGFGPQIRESGPVVGAPFAPVERHEAAWTQELTVEGLVELARSRSYVITLADPDRRWVLEGVRELARSIAGPDGRLGLPYVAYSFRAGLQALRPSA